MASHGTRFMTPPLLVLALWLSVSVGNSQRPGQVARLGDDLQIPGNREHAAGVGIERMTLGQVKVAQGETGRIQVNIRDPQLANPGDAVRLQLFAVDGILLRTLASPLQESVAFDLPTNFPEGAYRLVANIVNGSNVYDHAEKVYSVVNNTADDLRYGFYANFGAFGGDYVRKTEMLVDCYLNAIEYYDYFPAHGNYAPTQDVYQTEPFGGTIYVQDVVHKTNEASSKTILNIAYIAAYSAVPRIANQTHDYLTNQPGEPIVYYNGQCGTLSQLGGVWFHLMAFAPDTVWHGYIFPELARALDNSPADKVSFDGFEVDSYGWPGPYYSNGSSYNGRSMQEMLARFAGDVRTLTHSMKPWGLVSMNNISEDGITWAYDAVDFLFVENWKSHKPSYEQVLDMCYQNGAVRKQRLVSKSYPADTNMQVSAWPPENLRFLMGAHIAGGGSFMVAGEPREQTYQIGALNSAYYPDNQPQSAENFRSIRNYNAHDAALYRLNHGQNVHRRPSNFTLSGCLIREMESSDGYFAVGILHTGPNRVWTDFNTHPGTLSNLPIRYKIPKNLEPMGVFYGTPDLDERVFPQALDWQFSETDCLVRCLIPHLEFYGTLLVKHRPRRQLAFDSAADSVYDNGWQPGDNGGFGWTSGWSFRGAGANAGLFVGDSRNNGGGDHNGDGDINTAGRAWGLWADNGGLVDAVRTFSVLKVGEVFQIRMDSGYIEPGASAGVGLQNSRGENLFEIIFAGGGTYYITHDMAGFTNTSLGFTDEGLIVQFLLTSPTTYEVTLTSIENPVLNQDKSGALINPTGGQSIARVRLFNFTAGAGSSHDAFFNSVSILAEPAPPGPSAISAPWILYR